MFNRRYFLTGSSSLVVAWIVSNPSLAQNGPEIDYPAEWVTSDVAAVRRRLASFFRQATDGSLASPPPGILATNGWFTKFMRENTGLTNSQRPIQTRTPEGHACSALALDFMNKIRLGFSRGNHNASWLGNWVLAGELFNQELPKILQIAVTIVNAVYGGGAASTSITEVVNTQINRLANQSKGHGPTSGEHPNGWTSVDMRNQAAAFMMVADQTLPNLGPEAADLIETMKVFAKSMTQLNTQGHDPWLRADWQIGFTSITATAAQILNLPPD